MEQRLSTVDQLKELTQNKYVQERFKEVLGKKAPGFIASLISIVSSNDLLAKAEPRSVLNAAMTAATLDLPINPNLGFAYVIPYNTKVKETTKNDSGQDITVQKYVTLAQFQMGWKGFVQLAMRSRQFKTINVSDIREGEIVSKNRLTGEIKFKWVEDDSRDKLPVIGYVGYMALVNGFEKSLYMTVEELRSHGQQYSKSMQKGYGLWKDDFDAMASKTVIKLLLSKYAPLTTEMQTAALADQAVVVEEGQYEYVDNDRSLGLPVPESIAARKAKKAEATGEELSVEPVKSAIKATEGLKAVMNAEFPLPEKPATSEDKQAELLRNFEEGGK